MLILGLDMARCTGWAMGEAGEKPASGSWEFGPPNVPVFPFPGRLTDNLSAMVAKRGRPDLVAVEAFMSPSWSRSDRATISQLLLHGALLAWCHASAIKVVWENASTIRRIVCGRSFAPKAKTTTDEEYKLATKKMVRDHLISLKLFPADCNDLDRSDATCVWTWAERVHTRVTSSLVLTS